MLSAHQLTLPPMPTDKLADTSIIYDESAYFMAIDPLKL